MKAKLGLILLSIILSGVTFAKRREAKDFDLTIRSADNNNTITFGAEMQTRATFMATPRPNPYRRDDDVAEAGSKYKIDMRLKKAAIKVSGSFLNKDITYELKLNTLPLPEGAYLNKAYVDWVFHRDIGITVGRFDNRFSREANAIIALPDPSLAEDTFNTKEKGKGDGFMFHNDLDGRFVWSVGLVNHGLVGRIDYNHGDIDGYLFTDKRGGDLRYSIGGGAYVTTNYWDSIAEDTKFTVDGILKYRHMTADAAFYYGLGQKGEGDKLRHTWGGQIGAGYLLNHKWEPAVRYSIVHRTDDNVSHEVMAGLGYYFFGDHAKLQGYGAIDLNGNELAKAVVGADLFLKI